MAVNLKLGNNVFSKEKKIAELEKRVQELENKLIQYEKVNLEFQVRYKSDEKLIFELRNTNNL